MESREVPLLVPDMELRFVPQLVLVQIAEILETNKDWKKLMAVIPKDLGSRNTELKYTIKDQENIEIYSQTNNKWCAAVLFKEWGTSGRQRPTLQTLRDMLEKAKLYEASRHLNQILNGLNIAAVGNIHSTEMIPIRSPHNEDASRDSLSGADRDDNSVSCCQSSNQITDGVSNQNEQRSNPIQKPVMHVHVNREILKDDTLIQFPYEEIERITNQFTDLIGSGGFGQVFKGNHETLGLLAVKRSHNMRAQTPEAINEIFNTEVKFLSILRHKNIVPILGFALDGQDPCIVCKYIEGESLHKNLRRKVLNINERMNIMIGVAQGLKYIHSTVKPFSGAKTSSMKAYFVHGDVKSGNILLTKDCTPMLCDFGLARQIDTTTHYTKLCKGTPAYVAPERIHGMITQKGDVYSYGIVVLELLTGLKAIVSTSTGSLNIQEYIKDKCADGSITHVLDPMLKGWSKAQKIYELAQKCYYEPYRERPSMNMVCDDLNGINN